MNTLDSQQPAPEPVQIDPVVIDSAPASVENADPTGVVCGPAQQMPWGWMVVASCTNATGYSKDHALIYEDEPTPEQIATDASALTDEVVAEYDQHLAVAVVKYQDKLTTSTTKDIAP